MIHDEHRVLAARKESDSIETGKNDVKSSRLMERMKDFVLKKPLAESVAVMALSAGVILGVSSCGGPPFEVGGNTAQDASAENENESGANEGGNKDVNLESEANDSNTDTIISDTDAGETSLVDNSVNDVIDTGKDIGDETVIIQDTGNEQIVPDVTEEPANDSPNVDVVSDTSAEDVVSTDTNTQDVPADIVETGIDVSPEIGPEPMPEAAIETGPDTTVNDVVNDPIVEESGPSSPWQYKVVCTVTTGLPSGSDLSNFPAYCTLDSAGLIAAGKMRGDCYDIRVDGLSYEIEDGSCNTANTVIWMKLPLAKGGQGNQVNLLYGNPAAVNGQDASGVWSNGFSAVYHMGSLADSLGANNLAVHATAPTLVSTPCQYGKCYNFNNNGGFTVANNNLVNEGADFTWSGWGNASAYHTGTNSENGFLGTDDQVNGIELALNPTSCTGSSSATKIGIHISNFDILCSNTVSNINTQYQYALTHASNGTMSILIDGAIDSSATHSTNDSATAFNIGYFTSLSTKYFQGTIDEVRLETLRSADWMKAEYSVSSSNGSEGPNN